ncbi:MAG: sensor signal transduction histidine kinase [Candidatus Aminicenantes bacterium]|nr:sensor signal transduction histidine kinase [Candidatus Aminicenantes bacterium]
MIERYNLFLHEFSQEASKELQLFSIIAQSFFQPFSLTDNLLVIMTALTAGPGLGFNRAMLFLTDGDSLKGEFWLGPASAEEAESIWRVLSTPGIGYPEIIEHNRSLLTSETDTLTKRVKKLSYPLYKEQALIPALTAAARQMILVRDARNEPAVDRRFIETIGTDEFLCIPLVSQKEVLGEIILDNSITRVPIGSRDIELASICGLYAGNYIYTAKLQKRIVDMKKVAAMGEMAMFVTHQLRNPLVTIGGFADQLLDPHTGEKKKKRNIQIIRSEIRRLERILLRLSQFLRIDVREKVAVDVRDMLNLVQDSVRARIAGRRITLDIEIEAGLRVLLCDPTHVGEAVRNVLDNAVDAVGDEGHIDLRAYRENSEWAVIAVQDTGKGIPEAVKEKIFDSFVSTKERGMGLGLAYVKRVVDACGGRIEIKSAEGRGTTFKLYFKTESRERGTAP